MTLMLWIVRIIIIVLIIRFVISLIRGAMTQVGTGPRGPGARSKRQPERLGGTLVQDPQCGTYLPQDRAITVVAAGSPRHFCSTRCRDEWMSRER